MNYGEGMTWEPEQVKVEREGDLCQFLEEEVLKLRLKCFL
jgi:hypothetical protein